MNLLMLVGEAISDLVIEDTQQLYKESYFILKSYSNFRDANGSYLEYEFPVYLWRGARRDWQGTIQGRKVSIMGRLEQSGDKIKIIAEQLEFINKAAK